MDEEAGTNSIRYDRKRENVKKLINRMSSKANEYNRQYIKYKRITNVSEALMLGLSALLTSSLFVSFYGDRDVLLVSMVLSTVSSVGSAILRSLDFGSKQHNSQTSSLQYKDAARGYHNKLLMNGLSTTDLDNMLSSMNTRLGLLEDGESGLSLLFSP